MEVHPSPRPMSLAGKARPTEGSIFFVGTATVLLRFGEFTVLTDPNFLHQGDRVHLGYGLTARRLTEPALKLSELPRLDAVVLSHLHEDHFDRRVARELDRAVPIITTPHAAQRLRDMGFLAVRPIKTWEQSIMLKGDVRLVVTAMPGRHGPRFVSRALPPVMGSMLQFMTGGGARLFSIYITGDTLVHDALREIPYRHPDVDLALLHLGGTRMLGLMVSMDAAQGVETIRIIKPAKAIPIHDDDYDRFKSTREEFQRAVEQAGLQERVHYLRHGETYRFEVPASRWEAPVTRQ
ncbi:MAG: MBL fold metallo-hydrolase [Myxococcota bacterium]